MPLLRNARQLLRWYIFPQVHMTTVTTLVIIVYKKCGS